MSSLGSAVAPAKRRRRAWPPELWSAAVGQPVGGPLDEALHNAATARLRVWAFDFPPRPGASGGAPKKHFALSTAAFSRAYSCELCARVMIAGMCGM